MLRKRDLFLFFVLGIGLCLEVSAQKLSPNTEAFLLNPVTASTKVGASGINGQYVKAYVCFNDPIAIGKMESMGATIYLSTDNILTANLPQDKIQEIAELEEIDRIQIASEVNLCMDVARKTSNVNILHNATELEKAYKGTGVVVGIIDQGFQFDHINFFNEEQNEYRVKRFWDQNDNGKAPAGFKYGSEYTFEEDILDIGTDYPGTSHGTHVAGIAAGADMDGKYYGIATAAELILVSYGQNDVDISNAIKYIYNYAESVNKPCVINMSIGSHIGPHDGTSLTDRLADQLQGQGRLLVGAAGNEREDRIHLQHAFTPENNTLKAMFGYVNSSQKYAIVDAWGMPGEHFSVKGCLINRNNGGIVEGSEALSTENPGRKRFTFEDGSYMIVVSEVDPENNRPHIYINSYGNSLASTRALGVTVTAESGTVNLWSHNVAYFQGLGDWPEGDSNYSCGEIGGSGKRIISVGAFINKSSYKTLNGNTVNLTNSNQVGQIAPFSSMGPTLDGRMKPEISAPGLGISSSISSLENGFSKNGATGKTEVNEKNYYYGNMSGTSMAAPFVTGTLALWLEANPRLTPEAVKEIFKKTAINDKWTGDVRESGSNSWGHGKIDAYAGLVEAINFTGISETTMSDSSDIRFALSSDHQNAELLFMEGDSNVRVQLFRTSGAAVLERNVGQVADGQNVILPLSSLEQGVYILKVTGEKLNKSIKFAL